MSCERFWWNKRVLCIIYRYQRVGYHAVRQEVCGFFREAVETWQNAARLAPSEAWRDFALKRVSACRCKCR
ncbi:hypothetical protein FA830_23655 [Escherichia coli]|nr:hypothetical protein [Escherichia coli]EFN6818582.1 hypothetical protein [Escherichia coli O83:H15]EFC0623280.1 hypothetical protein [Escherichia coli]EFC0637263.1 hypothetical protein [Escherichia coli]EFC1448280.1 hypothetical protein [Escherichia coli]EFC1600530.1 hypothetical protein [Escherichia coli]